MKEKTKLKLEDIKIESFVTALEDNMQRNLVGATNYDTCDSLDGGCDSTADSKCPSCTCLTYTCCTETTGHMLCNAC